MARSPLAALRKAICAREIGVVLCHDVHSLSLDPAHNTTLANERGRHGVGVKFVTIERRRATFPPHVER